MKKSSFGFIQICKHGGETIEYLEFHREGRFHQHKDVEYFTVLQGSGFLVTDSERSEILEGEIYKVEPNTPHKMRPETPVLKILVSYSEDL